MKDHKEGEIKTDRHGRVWQFTKLPRYRVECGNGHEWRYKDLEDAHKQIMMLDLYGCTACKGETDGQQGTQTV